MSVRESLDGILDPSKRSAPESRRNHFPRKRRKPLSKSIAQTTRELRAKTTERDLRILETLHVLGVMSRHQIQRLEWGHVASEHVAQITANRLNILYKRWVLDANPFVRFKMADENLEPCDAYMLDSVGYALLAQAKQVARRELQDVGKRYKKGYGEPSLVIHDLMVSEVYTQFALELEGRHDLEGKWMGEWSAGLYEGERRWVNPDGILMLRKKEKEAKATHYFLEMDRHSRHQLTARWARKVHAYDTARRRAQWRGYLGMERFPPVLAVVPDGYGQRVSRLLKQQLDRYPGKPIRWCVKEWRRILEGDVLSNWYDLATGQGFNLG